MIAELRPTDSLRMYQGFGPLRELRRGRASLLSVVGVVGVRGLR
jgi:hypothetical protein